MSENAPSEMTPASSDPAASPAGSVAASSPAPPPPPQGAIPAVLPLLLGVVLFGLFALVATLVARGGGIVDTDLRLADDLHNAALQDARQSPTVVRAWRLVTRTADTNFLIGVTLIVAGALVARQRYLVAIVWVVAMASGGAMVDILKYNFDRPRPAFAIPLVLERSPSFPSGHAAGATLCYGLLAVLICRASQALKTRLIVSVVAAGWVAAVVYSRLYLGAHFLSDTVAGVLLGGGFVCVTSAILLGLVDPIVQGQAELSASP
jgi:undecaprenyl-diphosphatase